MHHRIPFGERVITITYNDQGDMAEERITSISRKPKGGPFYIDGNGNLIPTQGASEAPAQPEPLPATSETRYTYQYDSYGNWTEKVVEADQQSFATRRQITYY